VDPSQCNDELISGRLLTVSNALVVIADRVKLIELLGGLHFKVDHWKVELEEE